MGYGWVLSSADWVKPIAGLGKVPAEIAEQFETREIQMCMGGALAALSAPYTVPALFQGRDLVHFVDNQGALSCLVNGVSQAQDVGAVACLYQLVMARQNADLGQSTWSRLPISRMGRAAAGGSGCSQRNAPA